MIVTLTANPALDLTYSMERYASGTSIRTATAQSRAGGKGVNVARVLRSEGIDTLAIVPLGGLVGREFEADLVESDVPHIAVSVSSDTRRSIAVVERAVGDTTVLNETGEGYSGDEWDAIFRETIARLTDDCECLVIAGSLPPTTPANFFARLIGEATSREIPVVVDASGPWLLEAARAGASVVKPNLEELTVSTGILDQLEASRYLLDLGAGAVVLSMGADGLSTMVRGSRLLVRARIPQRLAGNPTGAGDAVVAAIATRMRRGHSGLRAERMDWPEVMRLAVAWSASAVLMPLAGELSPESSRFFREAEVSTIDSGRDASGVQGEPGIPDLPKKSEHQ